MDEKNLIRVLLVEPFDKPKIITIENNYQALVKLSAVMQMNICRLKMMLPCFVTLTENDFLFLQVTP